ncbi:MAG: penicillin acylase family protein [Myxococcota bacterium]
MRGLLVGLLVGSLAILGCGDDSSGDTGGTGGSAGSGGAGGDGGDGGTGGTPDDPLSWPPAATAFIEDNGIFHADCDTDEDCAMVLGYYHARDRFFQMDLQRRLSTGRLTSVVNKALVEASGLLEGLIDTAANNRALYSARDGRPAGEVAFEQTDDKTRDLYTAYAAGVNQWLADVRNGENGAIWPAEYSSPLLDYGPEDALEWTPGDSIATVLTLIGNLTIDENAQLRAANAREQINDNVRYQDLYSLEPIKKAPILEVGTFPPATATLFPIPDSQRPEIFSRAGNAMASLQQQIAFEDRFRMFPRDPMVNGDLGSNNWVLGPSKTANGNTFLANDPHLGLSQPSVWYIAHLDSKTNGSGTIHTAGATLAGLPYVIIGQNEDIAWGATNTGLDFTDVYLEELVKDEEGEPLGVMFNGEVVEFVRTNFVMDFADGSTEERELLFVPHHGPVRSIDADNDVAVTLRWTGTDITTDGNFPTAMAVATSVEEAREALTNVTTIGQNWVVIDNQGNFGWFPYNRIPKRTWAIDLDLNSGTDPYPWLPLLGTGEFEWEEYFEYEELPQAFNRANGYLATANSDHTGAAFDGNPTNDGFAPQQTDNIAAGYRTARIFELIDETDEHTRATNEALISDVQVLIGRDMVPEILAIANDDMTTLSENAQKIVNALTSWNYTCPTGLDGSDPVMSPLADAAEVEESSGCSAWHQTIRAIDDAIVEAEPTNKFPSGVTYFSIMDPSNLRAGDVYWDDTRTGVVETKYDIIGAALDEAGSALVNEFGPDETEWPWGRKHGFRLVNLLSSLSSLFNDFNNPSDGSFFANDGGQFTVDVANPGRSGIHSSGASMRFLCEGTVPVECSIQLPGGQSSHASSPNYDDLLPLYLDNQPSPIIFDVAEAANVAAETVEYRQ